MLLSGFADADGNVRVTHRGGRTHLAATTNASVVTDFYSFRDADGHLDDTIELWLANHAESPAAAVLRAAQAGVSPEPDHVPALARFVAAGLMRTAHVRAVIEGFNETAGPHLLAMEQLTRAGHDPLTLTARQFDLVLGAARRAWRDARDENEERKSILRTVQRQIDTFTAKLTTWTWTVLTADEPLLVTADVAVAPHPQTGTWRGPLPDGFPVYMPVSPTHVLVGEAHPLGFPTSTLTAELAQVVNTELAKSAQNVVITHPTMQWPANLTLTPITPATPQPRIAMSATENPNTFPARHREVLDPTIQNTLDALGAVDLVE